MSAPSKELIDALFRERVLGARAIPPEEKLRAGGELFDDVCERMKAGIRWQFPDADEAAVNEILRHRLEIARRLEQCA
jgi:hypothetical protein